MVEAASVVASSGARPDGGSTSDAGVGGKAHFRPDVEGLRAIAILAVVGYHAGLPFLPGGFVGVDVFFVISGFLITGLLVAEVTRAGHVSLARFWARRARRLLPAATLVLAATAAVSWLVLPALDHRSVGLDVVSAAFYVANMRFAAQSTDYLAADAAPSPVLHMWSLGVEEQFYLVWPLLILAVAAVAALRRRREGRPVSRRTLALVLAVLGVVSFAFSLWLTDRREPWAFFGMPTRAWEFAIGGLLAIGGAAVARVDARWRLLAGWLGVLALLGSVVLINQDLPYPGTAAVWPVLGTAGIIAAGTTAADRAGTVPRLMSLWPMRAIGRLSYSWYLWHWPALILSAAVWGELSVLWGVLIALAALVPSALAYRFVEQPIRHRPSLVADSPRSLRLGLVLSVTAALAGVALVLLPGGGALASTDPAATTGEGTTGRGVAPAPSSAPSASTTPGAGTPSASGSPTAAPVVWPTGPLTPDPASARDDLPVTYADGCHLTAPQVDPPPCEFGDLASPTTVVLLGDSHAAQWFPALERAASTQHWKLVSLTKSGCPAPDVTIYQRKLKRAYEECDTWRSAVLDRLTGAGRPALVVAAGTRTDSVVDRGTGEVMATSASGAEWQAGWRRTLQRLSDAGVPVAVVRDTPWPGKDMAVCVSQHESDPAACDVGIEALDEEKYDVGLASGYTGAAGVDLSSLICDAARCPATRGKYLVYRDTNHLTATFATALAPYLARSLVPLLESP